MKESTTVRVSPQTRDSLKELAEADGITLDAELSRLARAERQRRMGQGLAASTLDPDDERWIDTAVRTVDEGG